MGSENADLLIDAVRKQKDRFNTVEKLKIFFLVPLSWKGHDIFRSIPWR